MDNQYLKDVLVAIQADIVARNYQGAYGRCAVLFQMIEDEENK